MDLDPTVPPYSTSDQTSFAYNSVKDRWPVILTGAIDDMHRAVAASSNDEATREGKDIVANLAKLKHEVQHDRTLTPLPDDGQPDIAVYNAELEALGSLSWFNLPWLYGECYLYRRLHTLFTMSKHWKSYDVFSRQKMSTFRSSQAAVLELAARYQDLQTTLNEAGTLDEKAEALLFEEMCEICLWGNATDLSLLTTLNHEDIQKLQGAEARKASKQNIVADDLPAALAALRHARATARGDRRVDIVLDNAGFELFVDLVLAGYLLAADLATHIVLHPKSMPWFVSDVTPPDFAALLGVLASPIPFFAHADDAARAPTPLSNAQQSHMAFLFHSLSASHADGRLIIRPNGFWTQPGSYWRLPRAAPALWDDLRSSELVLFKGDLNYRKLTGDVMWAATTPFAHALGPLGPRSGLRVLALRTCKADVVVGLEPGVDERLRQSEGGGGDSGARKWAWSGKWAVVQFCDGKGKAGLGARDGGDA